MNSLAAPATSSLMNPVDLFMQADIVVQVVMAGLHPRQHLDLDDHRQPVAEDAPGRLRENERFERDFWKSGGYRRLLRGARQGASCRRPRCSPPASPNGGARPPAAVGRSRRHARSGSRWRCMRRWRRRPTSSPRGSTSSPRSARSRRSSACSARSGDHAQLHRYRRRSRIPRSPWSRPASPRRCSRPRSACSPRSRR